MADSDSASDPAAREFSLEGGRAGLTERQAVRRLTSESYRYRVGHYCQAFGRPGKPLDRKTVERWIRRGREIQGGPDLPPLDDPGAMAEWWRRCMVHKVPEVFEFLEGKQKGGGGPESPTAPPTDSLAGEKAVYDRAVSMADKAGLGFEASLERARIAERMAFAKWQAVMVEPEKYPASVIDRRQKTWEAAQSVLLRSETQAEKIMDRSPEWVRWDEVERTVGESLGVVNAGVRSLLARVATKVSLPAGLFDTLNRAFQAELDGLFANLDAGRFGELLDLVNE